jgi:hypothetical protein
VTFHLETGCLYRSAELSKAVRQLSLILAKLQAVFAVGVDDVTMVFDRLIPLINVMPKRLFDAPNDQVDERSLPIDLIHHRDPLEAPVLPSSYVADPPAKGFKRIVYWNARPERYEAKMLPFVQFERFCVLSFGHRRSLYFCRSPDNPSDPLRFMAA